MDIERIHLRHEEINMIIRFAADSSANRSLDPKLEVGIAPLKITAGDREFTDDGKLDVGELLDAMEGSKSRVATACPSVRDWLDAFGEADWIFGVAITSSLSGSFNSGRIAAEEYISIHPEAKVHIIDSLSTGPEMQLLLEKLRELALRELNFEEIVEKIREYQEKTRLLFSLESLENLAKNGRVSPLVAKAAGLLGIRLIGKASNKGTLEPLHKARGEKKALRILRESMEEMGYRGGKVRITHTSNEPAGEALKNDLLARYPKADVTLAPNGGLCACYSQRGGVMIGFETE